MKKLLIANRGEIAARVIRTARHLGLATVAVHSEADVDALHVAEADERVSIGPPAARESYLRIDQILEAARVTSADAVHPGYGFLSENPHFAQACRDAGLIFVGPPTEAIAAMGSKTAARATAVAADVPVIPGTPALASLDEAVEAANDIGYPLLLKPAGGGGGIAMVRAENEKQLRKRFDDTRRKAESYFGDASVYLERYLEEPHHIEVQIAADCHGNVIHLGERECSIQRRHQKVVEETPSPLISEGLRTEMTAAAVRLAKHVNYGSLGTVEMLVSGDEFFFLEMNTRLQVEHTVTEMVTGLDLVEWQIHLALDERLPALQDAIRFEGHSIQCRLYAENPDKGFLPSPGTLTRFQVPTGPGIRVDAGVKQGDTVTPFYDPLIAKLVVHAATRADAIARLQLALENTRIEGIDTNLGMHRRIAGDPTFGAGNTPTTYLREALGYRA